MTQLPYFRQIIDVHRYPVNVIAYAGFKLPAAKTLSKAWLQILPLTFSWPAFILKVL